MAATHEAGALRVLFLCTGNSCRSQMAEGWARALLGARVVAVSAGTRPARIDPRAVRAMAEAGVDITAQRSKGVEDLGDARFDLVVTVCDAAAGACPAFPGAARVIHRAFDDPPRLAEGAGSDGEAMSHYRRVRDEIRRFVTTLPEHVGHGAAASGKAEHMRDDGQARSCCADDCCGGAGAPAASAGTGSVREKVRGGYARIARGSQAGAGGGCCGGGPVVSDRVAAVAGYSAEELSGLPEGANMGLSCGNPNALASLRPGEVVLDLGSGGGFDCFIAGPKVGPTGRVIGVDMTPEMLDRARGNGAAYRERSGLDNVEFRLGEIENLPVADASVDVVISNCVLNLSPDKARVWGEIARVLKPGGRVAVSDLVLLKPLPAPVRADVEALVGCIAGAVLVEETLGSMRSAGLAQIRLSPKPGYVEALTELQDPLYRRIAAALARGEKMSDYITSMDIVAIKGG